MPKSLSKQILALKQYISIQELSNDSYYLSYQYKEDTKELYRLQKLLSQKTSLPPHNDSPT